MPSGKPHISVCVCTYNRPELLPRTLEGICAQRIDSLFSLSIVVVDNDFRRSAEAVVAAVAERHSDIPVKYCVEPEQNIALARNKALENANGDFVAFIDDDEAPVELWLVNLFKLLSDSTADGVLGPVNPEFHSTAPRWVIDAGFYERPGHKTGTVLNWYQCRTGNVLLKKDVVAKEELVFRPEFLSGEDQDFFKRKINQGKRFIWCDEAAVYEFVPPERWRRKFLIKRALMRGIFSRRNRQDSLLIIVESCVACVAYGFAVPVTVVFGQSCFMGCVFRLSYHTGRVLAAFGINPIRQPYVTG